MHAGKVYLTLERARRKFFWERLGVACGWLGAWRRGKARRLQCKHVEEEASDSRPQSSDVRKCSRSLAEERRIKSDNTRSLTRSPFSLGGKRDEGFAASPSSLILINCGREKPQPSIRGRTSPVCHGQRQRRRLGPTVVPLLRLRARCCPRPARPPHIGGRTRPSPNQSSASIRAVSGKPR